MLIHTSLSITPEGYTNDTAYDETFILKGFFKKYPGINGREVVVEQSTLIESLETSIEMYGEPVYGASNQFWIQEMHRMLSADGCKQLFSGQGGNFTISWPPPELAFRKKGLKRILKGFRKRIHKKSKEIAYVRNEFLESVHYYPVLQIPKPAKIHQLQPIYLRNSINYVSSLQKQVSLFRGIQVSDPTVDKELVRYCLSLPYTMYHDKQNSRKLVSITMKGMIPGEILQNRKRGIQASDIRFRMDKERENLLETLVFCGNNKLVKFVLDIEQLIEDLKEMNFLKMSRREVNHLMRVISVALFLKKQTE